MSRTKPSAPPQVTIVIPSRARRSGQKSPSVLEDCVASIVNVSTYANFDLVIVHDSDAESSVIDSVTSMAATRIRWIPFDEEFNFSRKMNMGVTHSTAPFVLCLNDDVTVITPDWIERMLEPMEAAGGEDVAMVGAMLYFPKDIIQHAGHIYVGGLPTHVGIGEPRGSAGPEGDYREVRERMGVTAACALIRRDVFDRVGGFCELLPGNYNDVDLCLKVRSCGFRILWTPRAELYHFESVSRDPGVSGYELDFIHARWGANLEPVSLHSLGHEDLRD